VRPLISSLMMCRTVPPSGSALNWNQNDKLNAGSDRHLNHRTACGCGRCTIVTRTLRCAKATGLIAGRPDVFGVVIRAQLRSAYPDARGIRASPGRARLRAHDQAPGRPRRAGPAPATDENGTLVRTLATVRTGGAVAADTRWQKKDRSWRPNRVPGALARLSAGKGSLGAGTVRADIRRQRLLRWPCWRQTP
jgi:hypothetical protein